MQEKCKKVFSKKCDLYPRHSGTPHRSAASAMTDCADSGCFKSRRKQEADTQSAKAPAGTIPQTCSGAKASGRAVLPQAFLAGVRSGNRPCERFASRLRAPKTEGIPVRRTAAGSGQHLRTLQSCQSIPFRGLLCRPLSCGRSRSAYPFLIGHQNIPIRFSYFKSAERTLSPRRKQMVPS